MALSIKWEFHNNPRKATAMNISNIPLTCPKCGTDQLIYPENPSIESQLSCKDCGHSFLARDAAQAAVNAKAIQLATELATAALGKVLKR